ncbi:MAG TPA: hypothetical protein VIV60_15100, partial [Polyangiaceae bacterium]
MTQNEVSDPRLEAAHLAANQGQFDRSEQLLLEVLSDDPANLLALDILGFVQYFLGRPADA